MWNEFYSLADGGTMSAVLGVIWVAGLGLATYAWFTLPGRRH